MRPAQIDIQMEVQVTYDLDSAADPRFWAEATEAMLHKADEVASSVGGRVRTDRPPEILSKIGTHNLVGGEWVLVASRWWVDVPDDFHGDGR